MFHWVNSSMHVSLVKFKQVIICIVDNQLEIVVKNFYAGQCLILDYHV